MVRLTSQIPRRLHFNDGDVGCDNNRKDENDDGDDGDVYCLILLHPTPHPTPSTKSLYSQLARLPAMTVFVSVSVFMALSTVFHCINSPDNFPFSHSVLPVLSLPYCSFV